MASLVTTTVTGTITVSSDGSFGGANETSATLFVRGGNADFWNSTNSLLRINHDGTRANLQSFTGGAYDDLALNPDGGSVGIGTNAPTQMLEVRGTQAAIRIHDTYSNVNQSLLLLGSDLHNTNTKDSWIKFFGGAATNDRTWSIGHNGNAMFRFNYLGTRATAPTGGTTVLNLDGINNRVGINTNAPGYGLDVYGTNARVGTNLRLGNGTSAGNANDPAITVSGYTNAGIYFESSGVGLGAGTGKYLFLNSNGNVTQAGGAYEWYDGSGAKVGEISTIGGNNLTISGTQTNHCGLSFATNAILPATQSATNNNTVDLGANGNAFKDFYIQGTAYVRNSGGNNILWGKGTGWGYSPNSYKAIQIGDASGNFTVSIGYDPAGNTSSAFTGDGTELLFRNDFSFVTPNAANNGWHYCMHFKDGNVGIGTVTPGSLLSVSGNSDDGDGACTIAINDEDSTGGSKIPAIQFYGGGTTQGRIRGGDTAFQIAVGSSPTTALNINTTNGYPSFTYGSQVRLTLGSTGAAESNTANWVRANGANLEFNAASGDFNWEVGGTHRMRLTDSGVLGVGLGAGTDPFGSIHANGTNGGIYQVTRTSGSTTGTLGIVRFGNTDIDSNLINIKGVQDGATDSGRLEFQTQPTGGSTVTRMSIKSNGETHIGADLQGVAIHGNTSGYGSIVGVSRDGSSYKNLEINGATVELKAAGALKMTVASGGVGINVAPDGGLKIKSTGDGVNVLNITDSSDDAMFNVRQSSNDCLIRGYKDSGVQTLQFHSHGESYIMGNPGGGTDLQIGGSAVTSHGTVVMANGTGASIAKIRVEGSDDSFYLSKLAGSGKFYLTSDGEPIVLTGGSVGIGTDGPETKLHVEGSNYTDSSIKMERSGSGINEDAGLIFSKSSAATDGHRLGGVYFGHSGTNYALIRAEMDASTGGEVYIIAADQTNPISNTATKTLQITASETTINGIFRPRLDSTYTLGTNANRWSHLYIDEMTAADLTINTVGVYITGGTNIDPSSGGAGQFRVTGNGYTSFLAMNGTAAYFGHNSSGRSLVLMTNETARLTITGGGAATFSSSVAASSFSGNGASLTSLNATQLTSGTVPAARLGNVTIASSATDILSASSGSISADDAGADKIVFWDDSASKLTYLTVGSNLSISGTTISASGGGGGGSGTVTEVTVGTGLDVSSGTTTPNITLDFNELATAGTVSGSDDFVVVDGTSTRKEQMSSISLSGFSGYYGLLSSIYKNNGTGDSITPDSSGYMYFYEGTGIGLSFSGNSITFSSSTGSDYRLKKNISTFNSEAWTKVKGVNLRKFDFDEDAFKTAIASPDREITEEPKNYTDNIGFIAHELAEAGIQGSVIGDKDAVDEDGNFIYQKVNYIALVPVLWGALKEAISKIETLESKVQALEDK